jgi:hypothetical protein
MRLDRLPVEGHDERVMALELEPEDSRRRGIDEPQANTFAGSDREMIGNTAIDRDRVADPARHAHFHAIAKAARDRSVVIQAKVAKDPDDIPIDRRGLGLLGDQCAHQAPPDLLGAVRM